MASCARQALEIYYRQNLEFIGYLYYVQLSAYMSHIISPKLGVCLELISSLLSKSDITCYL